MQAKEVLLVLTDQWADWEASYAVWLVNSVPEYTVKTMALDKQSKVSVGGLRAEIDYAVNEYTKFENLAMVILTGSFSWKNESHNEIADFVKKAHDLCIPIAAICGGVVFLGKHGFLNNVKHTGNSLERFQKEPNYNGTDFFVSAQAVADQNIITANETAALEFAREIFRTLKIYTDEDMDDWYDEFKNGMVR
ncbi:MAG: DJ-1/PfpI family protein [Defluviitaleaceae bacterium]|nr:DJ-1/PfpI family protein [Defluviitaleaceae bacterium]MCL2275022.1 DJ-1/PfpI family protein [Defluviitaleaceae bacterium]